MSARDVMTDARTRFKRVGDQSQKIFRSVVASRHAVADVARHNGRTLVNTEIGAAKNIASAVRASVRKMRGDGVRKVVTNPKAYVPNGRRQVVSAFKDSVDVIKRTKNDLTDVLDESEKQVEPAAKKAADAAAGKPERKARQTNRQTKSTTRSRAKTSKTSSAGSRSKSQTSSNRATAARKTASTRSSSTRKQGHTQGSGKSQNRNTTPKTASGGSTKTTNKSANASSSGKTDNSAAHH